MSNVSYRFSEGIGYGTLPDGTEFTFDSELFPRIKDVSFYRLGKSDMNCHYYIGDCRGKTIHRYLLECPRGYEVDHINQDTFDNRRCNLRIVTHQQNQINQPPQRNNTSGCSGVNWHKSRNKWRARIKVKGQEICLGYYKVFEDAVAARNAGMEIMFGDYAHYDMTVSIPETIMEDIKIRCLPYQRLMV